MIKVLLADAHPVVCMGLRHLFSREKDLTVVGEADSILELRQLLRKRTADVLVFDLDLLDVGLDVFEELRRLQPALAVVVFSAVPAEVCAVRALRAGVAAYLSKTAEPRELVQAVRKVHGGGRYLTPAVAELLAAVVGDSDRPRHESLTVREFQVLRLLGSGKTVSEAAEQLLLSVKTVSTYRTHLLEKLGLRNNAELMRYAIRNAIV